MRPALLVAVALYCLTGCNADTADVGFFIDNPTDQALKVTVDGKSYDVPAHGEQKVSLKPGPHTLASAPSGTHRFIVFSRGRGAVINPTFSTYVIVSTVYATNAEKAQSFKPLEHDVEIDGIALRGPFQVRDELFIEKEWTFGVHEDFSDSMPVDQGRKGNIFNKIFTRADFIKTFEEEQKEPGFFAKNGKPSQPRPHWYRPEFPVFKDAEVESKSTALKDLCRRYLKAEDSETQARLKKEFWNVQRGLDEVVAGKRAKMDVAENRKLSELIRVASEIVSRSAVVSD